jgi:hypothetical protein
VARSTNSLCGRVCAGTTRSTGTSSASSTWTCLLTDSNLFLATRSVSSTARLAPRHAFDLTSLGPTGAPTAILQGSRTTSSACSRRPLLTSYYTGRHILPIWCPMHALRTVVPPHTGAPRGSHSQESGFRTNVQPSSRWDVQAALTDAGDESGPGRVSVQKCPCDSMTLYHNEGTPIGMHDCVASRLRFDHYGSQHVSKLVTSGVNTDRQLS